MLADLDETIRHLLIHDVPLDPGEVDVSFDAPDRDWSSRLSRPTVNCFLYDLRENHELRRTEWETGRANGGAVTRRPLIRVDATYQITVWARAPEDEHRLLWRVLAALFRHPVLTDDDLQGDLRGQDFRPSARVVQPGQMPMNYADLWQSLDNRIRPSLTYIVTLALDPAVAYTTPLVFTRVTRTHDPAGDRMAETFLIAGHVRDADATGVSGATVTLRESGATAATDAAGRFAFERAPGGPITLVARAKGFAEVTRQVDVPAPGYDLDLTLPPQPAGRRGRSRDDHGD